MNKGEPEHGHRSGSLCPFSYISARTALTRPFPCRPHHENASAREAWSAVKVVVIAVLAARFVQGLFVTNEAGYRDNEAQILLVASPLVSVSLIIFTKRPLGDAPERPLFTQTKLPEP